MAFDPKPSTWLGAGYSLASSAISLNTATAGSNVTLPELTDIEAHADNGDIRKVAFALCEALHQAWLTQAATTPASTPTKMTISRTSSSDDTAGTLTRYYTFRFDTVVSGEEVDDET